MPNVNEETPNRATLLADAIAAELRAEKSAKGTQYDEISASTGIAVRTLARYFKGTRSINAEALLFICDALSVSASDIIERARTRAAL